MSRAVVWFRRGLRLADHPALVDALGSGEEVGHDGRHRAVPDAARELGGQ